MTKRASSKYIYYALQLYSSGLSVRETSKDYYHLSKEIMYLFGIGFSTSQGGRCYKGKEE
jgi:hypothetical protein